MIIIALQGRTANQLYQYLFARQFTDEVIYTIPCPINGDLLQYIGLNEVNVRTFKHPFPLKNGDRVFTIEERTMDFDIEVVDTIKSLMDQGENIHLKGYWQNPRYIKPELRKLTEMGGERKKFFYKVPSNHVAIHIRGTDYKGWQLFDVCDKQYYERALEYFPEDSVLDVYTDDLNYAQTILEGIQCNFIKPSKEPIQDLLKMSQYWNIITPNSSFSGLAAGINWDGRDKKVVQPKKWFNQDFASQKEISCQPQWEGSILI